MLGHGWKLCLKDPQPQHWAAVCVMHMGVRWEGGGREVGGRWEGGGSEVRVR